jgi:hypothetical protein
MKAKLAALLLIVSIAPLLSLAKSPHYTFILPDKYVGWVQIIFNDSQASPLPLRRDKGYEIEVPESGIARTSDIRVQDSKSKDEFWYHSLPANGKAEVFLVPSEYVMLGVSHGGFGVMDTGGKGLGYSWFIFIGPPELRTKVPLADWDRVVEEYSKTHAGRQRVEAPDPYPTPGRMPSVQQ